MRTPGENLPAAYNRVFSKRLKMSDRHSQFARRDFLRTVAGTALFTSSASLLGRAHFLRLSSTVPATARDRLQPEWYQRKIRQVQQEMDKRRLDALVLLRAVNVIYTTGYFHLSTERPLAALIPKSGSPVLFIPELEALDGAPHSPTPCRARMY